MSLIAGWGRGTWGEGAWSTPLAVSVTGVAGTTALGTAVPDTGITVPVTGVQGVGFISGHSATTITFTVTVVSTASGNKYFIDGVQQDTLDLYEGNTYRFDQSDSSNSGHPLRLSETPNGTHGGGSAYTTGVTTNGTPGSSGAYTQITVANPAPTLYYYCSVHSGMGGQANTPAITSFGQTVQGVAGTGAVGNAVIGINISFAVSGLSASTALGTGTIAPTLSLGVAVTGVSATGFAGEEILWERVIPSQTPSWSNITASQTPNWTDIAA